MPRARSKVAGAEISSRNSRSAIWRRSGLRHWQPRDAHRAYGKLVDAMKKVTVEDVNRVAKTYATMSNAIAVGDAEAVAFGGGGFEQGFRRRGDHDGCSDETGYAAGLG